MSATNAESHKGAAICGWGRRDLEKPLSSGILEKS